MDHIELGFPQYKENKYILTMLRNQRIVYEVGKDLQVTVFERSWHLFLQLKDVLCDMPLKNNYKIVFVWPILILHRWFQIIRNCKLFIS